MREDLAHDQRREPEARLVEHQQARRRHQRAAQREHLALAAGQRAGQLRAALGQARKARVDRVAASASARRAAALREGAEQQVVRTASSPNSSRFSGHQAQAALDARLDVEALRGRRRRSARRRATAAGPSPRASSVVLPAPFGPITVTIWPGCMRATTPRTASTLP